MQVLFYVSLKVVILGVPFGFQDSQAPLESGVANCT